MDLQLEKKRALVAGGSGGIGKPIAAALLAEGAAVAISGHRPDYLAAAANDLEIQAGRPVPAFSFDIREDESTTAMVSAAAAALGGLDILVNTGAPQDRGLWSWDKITTEPFLADMNIKALGYLRSAQAAAPYMIEGKWGRIINIAGVNVRRSTSLMGTVRNSAVSSMTKSLADELGQYGINVTVVHPGSVSSEREPRTGRDTGSILGRSIDAKEIAWVVAFLASPLSAAITGDAVPVGGGLKGQISY